MEPIIRVENLHFSYNVDTGRPVRALAGIDLSVATGEYLVILGHNGSGKSTLARHLNGLLLPTEGDVWVAGHNTRDREAVRTIRSTVGMVFQTPDNQIVATIVEEDVAFGPENLGLPHGEIVQRVDWSLEQVGMNGLRHRAPHLLSGGQKQRVCIAGMLAMQPQVLVLDEATAMLDPLGRREVLEIARRLNKEAGVTIVAITHYMEEAVEADRLIVMTDGQIALQGTPRAVFAQVDQLRALHMDVPQVTQLAHALAAQLPAFPTDILTIEELTAAIARRLPTARPAAPTAASAAPAPDAPSANGQPPVIAIEDLVYFYMYNTPLQVQALYDVDLDVRPGEILGIIGHTGSGKSTIIQHLNALLRPHKGRVTIFGQDVNGRGFNPKPVRQRIGLAFQHPEAQLFEHYVGDDVAYGPRNLKLSREEVRERVRWAMEAVGLGFEAFKDRITFSLSGGQMRRVALAGVLALRPEVLVLDEPTAGLDPAGRDQLLAQILALHRDERLTLVLVSHNMEELARVCDRICVVADGRVVMIGSPRAIFRRGAELRELGLGVPAVADLFDRLQAAGMLAPLSGAVLTVDEAVTQLTTARPSSIQEHNHAEA